MQPVLSPTRALEFIANAGEVLSSSLDYEQTLRRVARLAVPEFADWCAVYVPDGANGESDITSGHDDPELEALLLEIRRGRRDVEGASESRRVAETGEPILASDVRASTAADIGAEQRQHVARLTPRSYMIVPLLARGRSMGSLTLLSARAGRHYGHDDLALATTLAARCAVAIDNARLHDAAERSLTLLDNVFATAPVGLAFVDCDRQFVRVNPALAEINGLPVEAHVGLGIGAVPGDAGRQLADVYRKVLEDGEPIEDQQIVDGERHFGAYCTPVRGADDGLLGIGAVVLDVTERHRSLEAERDARERADFLARAGAILDETLDYEKTLKSVAEITVPSIADWCAVSVLDDRDTLQQVVAAHVDPVQRQIAEELNRRFTPTPGSGSPLVAATGKTEWMQELTDEMLVAGIPDPEQLALVRQLGLRSVIIAALRAHGRTFGTLTLANAASSRLFEPADVQLAEELARRAGTAINNARLYTERTHIAHTLQARLLPDRLPEIPGARLAARYRAAGELNEVGGDFYDVFRRADDEWVMVVGDVSGKGPEAAAVTALARYTLRAGAAEDGDPITAAMRLNTAMRDDEAEAQFATAVVAYVSPGTGRDIHVRLVLAGHPPAMIVRRGGAVEAVGTFGTMVGLMPDPLLTETRHTLHPGETILLYTDGVTEAGDRVRPFGDYGFTELLTGLAGAPPDAVVDAVERAVVDAQDGQPRDDVALLALSVKPAT
jgi:PAS domain S-box-containing protein